MTTTTSTTNSTTSNAGRVRPRQRINLAARTPAVFQAMNDLDEAVASSGVEPALAELLRIRASQLNGCAYCLDMHTLDARAGGESEQRIYALSAWPEAPFFTERERAALALAEAVTFIHDGHVPDEVYDAAAAVFDETELARLIWLAVVINTWNRIAITSRSEPGHYTPGA